MRALVVANQFIRSKSPNKVPNKSWFMALYKKIDFTFYLTKTTGMLKDLKQKQNIDVFTISQCSDSLNLHYVWVAHRMTLKHVHHVVKFYMNLSMDTDHQNLKQLYNTKLITKTSSFCKELKTVPWICKEKRKRD